MAERDSITTKFKVDISDLKKGITEANQQIKLANSAFKAASDGTKEWENSTEGMQAKIKQLQSVLEAQNNKLKTYQQELERAKQYESEASKEVDRLKQALEQAKSEYGENSEEVKQLERSLSSAEQAEQAMHSQVQNLTVTMNNQQGACNRTASELEELEGNLEDCGEEAEEAESHFGELSKTLLSGFGKACVAGIIAIGSAVANLTKQSIEGYAEFEQLIGGVNKLFGTGSATNVQEYARSVGKSVKDVQKEYNTLQQASKQVATNAMNAFRTAGMDANTYMENATMMSATLIKSLKGDTVKAAGYVDKAISQMSDNANTFGTDLTSIQFAYSGFARANYTMLDNLKLGYSGTKEGMQSLIKDASKMKKEQKELNITVKDGSLEYSNIIDAIDVMQKHLGIAGTSTKEMKTTVEGSLGMMSTAWSNFITSLSTNDIDTGKMLNGVIEALGYVVSNVAPKVKAVTTTLLSEIPKIIPEALKGITEITKELNLADMFSDIVNGIIALLPNAINLVFETISNLLINVANMLPNLTNVGVKIIQSLISGITKSLPSLLTSIASAVPKIAETLISLLPNLVKSVSDLILGIVKALPGMINTIITALPSLIKSISDALPALIGILIEGITQLINELCVALPSILNAIIKILPQLITSLVTAITSHLPIIIEGIAKIVESIAKNLPVISKKIVEALPELIKSLVEALIRCVPDLIKGIVDVIGILVKLIPTNFSILWNAIVETVSNWDFVKLFNFEGISNAWKTCTDKIKSLASDAWNGITNIWNGVSSWFTNTVINPVKSVFSTLWSKIKSLASDAWNGIKSVWNTVCSWFTSTIINPVKSAFSTFWSKIKSGAQTAWNGVKNAFSGFVSFFSSLWSKIKNTFSGLGTKIGDAIGGAVKTAINGVILFIERTVNRAINLINGAIGMINKLPGVSVGRVNNLSLPRLATGGVLKRGQVGLLEGDGAEAVVPLERNKYWIGRVANEMMRQLGGSNINSLSRVNNTNTYNFYQTNNSPKALSRLDIYRQTKNQLSLAKGV